MHSRKKVFVFLLAFLLLFSINSFSLEERPNSIKEMTATITLSGSGKISGTTDSMDELTLKMLSFKEFEGQEIIELNETLSIGGQEFGAGHEDKNGARYAVFRLKNLKQFGNSPKFEVKIKAKIKTKAGIGLNETEENENKSELNEFLKPTDFIESNEPELISKALIEFKSNDELETLKEISEWVSNNLEYDMAYYDVINSAKKTYELRHGVCDEFANLTAAFLRIKGIPVKYVSGISFDGQEFGNHGWNEAYVKGIGWIPVDSTYREAGFIDAAHFILSKGNDANEFSTIESAIKSVHSLGLELHLNQPKVEVNSFKQFSGLTETEFIVPEKLETGEKFTSKAKITSKAKNKMIYPLELALHEDFYYSKKNKLIILSPNESKEIEWNARAPLREEKGKYFTYEAKLLEPSRKITETISVYPNEGKTTAEGELEILDVSPFKKNNSLKVKAFMLNTALKEAKAKIWFENDEGKKTTENEIQFKALEEKEIELTYSPFDFGEITLAIEANGKEFRQKIFMPKENEMPIVREEETQDNEIRETANQENTGNSQKTTNSENSQETQSIAGKNSSDLEIALNLLGQPAVQLILIGMITLALFMILLIETAKLAVKALRQ